MQGNPETIANCEACNSPMDISAVAPFSNVVCPSCGHQERVKTQFGPYTLTHRYAVGGMSMVFCARDHTLNREVAVKILSENYSQDEKRIKAFEEEARITASFSHPNVVSVLRTGHAFGRYYIAMELVPGGHFEHHIRERKRIPEEELLPIAIQVAQGLKAAKAAGLIHRDVKPGNILLAKEGHAKLVDFGLSLVTQGGTAKAEELWATPFYVPPETVEGQEEDFRSDIYALGSTLYHALAGTPPCNEDSMATDRLLKAKTEIIPLKQVAPDVSDETCEIVTQSMAYFPSERYTSYDDMIHALRKAQKSLRRSKNEEHLRATQAHTIPSSSHVGKLVWIMIYMAMAAILVISFVIPTLEEEYPELTQGENQGNRNDNNNANNDLNLGTTQESIANEFRRARNALYSGEYKLACELFSRLHDNKHLQEPTRSWAGVESVLSAYLDGKSSLARKQAKITSEHLSALSEDHAAAIGVEITALLIQLESLPPLTGSSASQSGSQTVLASMLAGLKNWQQGLLEEAAECFKRAATAKLSANDQWVEPYQGLASDYLADYSVLTGPLFGSMPIDLRRCEKLIEELDEAVGQLKTRGRARYNLRAWQLDLARKAKELREEQAR